MIFEWFKIIEGSRLPITRTASANQNVTYDIPHENPEDCPPCLAYKLSHSSRGKGSWVPNNSLEMSNVGRSLVAKDSK